MAQQVKELVMGTGDQSLISKTHMKEKTDP